MCVQLLTERISATHVSKSGYDKFVCKNEIQHLLIKNIVFSLFINLNVNKNIIEFVLISLKHK